MAERVAEYLAVLGSGTVPAVHKKPPTERGGKQIMTVHTSSRTLSLSLSLIHTSQALLKAVFISWAEGHKSLEKLIAELLVELRFPIIDKPPLCQSFGPLKEIVIPPLAVVSSLPYTSTDAVCLLRAVGEWVGG